MFTNRADYNSPAYRGWRFGVFKRDQWECQLCHCKGTELNCHHIIRYADAPHLRYAQANGITLCKVCHDTRVTGHEESFVKQFKEIVAMKRIVATQEREARTGKKTKKKPPYKPRNPNIRF